MGEKGEEIKKMPDSCGLLLGDCVIVNSAYAGE
jgi:hypothetical protein